MSTIHLNTNQFAVGKAELSTGHVLKNDDSLFLTGEDKSQIFEIFEDYVKAKLFATEKVKTNPSIECWIIDSKGKTLFTCNKHGEKIL